MNRRAHASAWIPVAVAVAWASSIAPRDALAETRTFGGEFTFHGLGRIASYEPTQSIAGAGVAIGGGPVAAISPRVRAHLEFRQTLEGLMLSGTFALTVPVPFTAVTIAPSVDVRVGDRLGIGLGPFTGLWVVGFGIPGWSVGGLARFSLLLGPGAAALARDRVRRESELQLEVRAEHSQVGAYGNSSIAWSVSIALGVAWRWWR